MLYPSLLPRFGLASALAATLAVIVFGAQAAGLGAGQSSPVLGQPLDFAVPLRIGTGESLTPECVRADVAVGERQLPAPLVRTTLEAAGPDSARVRVHATPPLDEPVVTVTIQAGCNSQVVRRYVLFVEPAVRAPAMAAPAYAAALPDAQATTPSDPPAAASAGSTAAAPAPAPAPAPATAPATAPARAAQGASGLATQGAPTTASTPTPADQSRAVRTTPRPSGREARHAGASKVARASHRKKPTHKAVAARPVATPRAATPAATARSDAVPRLKLEAAEPTPDADAQAVAQALEAVAQAASAARATAATASAAAERIAALERSVEQLRTEARLQSEEALLLRDRLARAENSSRWLTPLIVLVLLLAAVASWLAWRLSAIEKRREVDWRRTVAPALAARSGAADEAPMSSIPLVTSEISPRATEAVRAAAHPAWPPPVRDAQPSPAAPPARADIELPEPSMQRTHVLPPGVSADVAAARDVSIEELIDLEQQAEFFVVLGQDEAAIDLLVEHLRQTGGSSPLPYLKLLEIYRRRGDRETYERMRARFNRRFNAYAPDWGVEWSHGRSLEDYAGVVPRLQQAWARPIDAMAELEAMLFRRSGGELFDLPAYREVLFLYSLARDLLDRESLASGNVDLLLPIADEVDAAAASAHPHLGLESDAVPPGAAEERVTVPVDLDLSGGERPTSIFDPLDDASKRP